MVLPFLSNFLVRTYAIKGLLGHDGWIMNLLHWLRWVPEDTSLSQGAWAVGIGLLTNYLPLMTLPLYIGFERFDFSILEAAKDLGAGPMRSFFTVFLPNVKSSLYSACFMVFVPALGEFLIPDILGGAQVQTVGKMVAEQFLKTRDWPFGAALTFSLMLLLILSLFRRSNNRGQA
jgi:spermidine/putrescine transport system permease protein